MLGADGALVGSRLWATQECLAPQGAKDVALTTNGDGTARTAIFDILRRKNWPAPYDFRAIRNSLHRRLEGPIEALRADRGGPRPLRPGRKRVISRPPMSPWGKGWGWCETYLEPEKLIQRMHTQAQAVLGQSKA